MLTNSASEAAPRAADSSAPRERSAASPEARSVAFFAFAEEVGTRLLGESKPLPPTDAPLAPPQEWEPSGETAERERRKYLEQALRRLAEEYPPESLDARTRLQRRVLQDELESRLAWQHTWGDHVYPLNQIVGLHLEIPDTLIERHPIRNARDAEAYIRRIEGVPRLIDDLIARMKRQETAGVLMPRSVYPHLLAGARGVIAGAPHGSGPASPLWADFQRKLESLKLSTEVRARLLDRAMRALQGRLEPAYEKLIARLAYEQGVTRIDGGVWQLPRGDDFYRFAVRLFTTTDLSPEAVHEAGLVHVARLHREMAAVQARMGFEGSLPQYFDFMRSDARFFLPNTEDGRSAYLTSAQRLVAAIASRAGEILPGPPQPPVEVRRFPAYREPSAPRGFYQPASPGGPNVGVIFLNLADMRGNPTHGLDALLYHEGIPGHHLQISHIRDNAQLPALRRVSTWWLYGAFVEGWALYAEQLAREMGYYGEPQAEFGRLAAELWRASRLVVDTGLHWKRWSREQAIDYLLRNTPGTPETCAQEVDRYLIVPGQATGFMIGMQRLLEIRRDAQQRLGPAFDIREFHAVVLSHGFVPLWAVEAAVRDWMSEKEGSTH